MAKRDSLVVASKIKDFIKGKKCMTAGDLAEALSNEVYGMLEKAVKRCKSNKRSTVRPGDL